MLKVRVRFVLSWQMARGKVKITSVFDKITSVFDKITSVFVKITSVFDTCSTNTREQLFGVMSFGRTGRVFKTEKGSIVRKTTCTKAEKCVNAPSKRQNSIK